jgi:uncharacterized protein (TIGR03382 family)
MELITFIFFLLISGLIVGALGRLAIPGPDPMGIGMTILVGIGGSLIGGLIGAVIFGRGGPGFILAVGGAALLVWLLRRRRPRVG